MTAVGSFLDARAKDGEWLVRMEDLDGQRQMPGAAEAILRTLDDCGLHWDGPVRYQHTRLDAYQAALDRLRVAGLVFPCACSRSEIADSGLRGLEGHVYAGACRDGLPLGKSPRALRVQVPDETLVFHDELQGNVHQNLAREIGDFIVQRADGPFAYQLAVVVDDAFQGITHIVRGADLLLSTPRQIYLQRLLALPTPVYMHLPVAVNAQGEKLSKQTHAEPMEGKPPGDMLFQALDFLNQSPPGELRQASPSELLRWGTVHWRPERIQIGRAHV